MNESSPGWSTAAGEAGWIGERLSPFGQMVTSVVPGGFAAYARVLHPAWESDLDSDDERLVRWREVAAWNGLPLRRDAQFHSIALPPALLQGDAPWPGRGPEEGNLHLPDAEVLAALAREWTTTPEQCWFCLWDGYDLIGTPLTRGGEPAERSPDPIPGAFRHGPRVSLPNRDYLLYAGPVEAVTATAELAGRGQTPNLWWPADRAWCVATEIDLLSTYVGGTAGLIERILADERIEALSAEPGDALTHVEDWVIRWAEEAAAKVMADGEAVIATPCGTVAARLDRRSFLSGRVLRISYGGDGFSCSSAVSLNHRGGEDLRDEICRYLTSAILDLAEG